MLWLYGRINPNDHYFLSHYNRVAVVAIFQSMQLCAFTICFDRNTIWFAGTFFANLPRLIMQQSDRWRQMHRSPLPRRLYPLQTKFPWFSVSCFRNGGTERDWRPWKGDFFSRFGYECTFLAQKIASTICRVLQNRLCLANHEKMKGD